MTRTDRGRRVIHAARDRIYQALTQPDALESWLPPEGMTGRMDRFDPSPGGGYRMTLSYLDAAGGSGKSSDTEDVVDVVFVELEPDERVVERVVFDSDDPAYAGTMTMTWRLTGTTDGTEVEVVAEDVPAGISEADHEAGIASSLANLAAYAER